jgi:HlyD family secretion protein
MRRILPFVLAIIAVAACTEGRANPVKLPTAAATRTLIAVRVQATGIVQPIDPVDVKSKTSGLILEMPVDVGSKVKKGDLIVQLDPRDARAQYDQAVADDVVTASQLRESRIKQTRQETLFVHRVITVGTLDSARSATQSAIAQMVGMRANVDLKRQALEDITVRAPMGGIIVSRPASRGQIITGATGPNGGTTVVSIADLTRVRMRVTVDEVEMGNVRVGEMASVQVDAFPDRAFQGRIEKIEPQAVVTQGVTLFPVMVSISNEENLLMPGMNGEVTMFAAEHPNVLTVPIDGVRNPTELGSIARVFKMTRDSLASKLRSDLVPSGGFAQVAGKYAVVAKPDSTYELRLVRTGANDFQRIEVLDGIKEGEQVVLLGSVSADKLAGHPELRVAADIQRSARPVRQTGGNR